METAAPPPGSPPPAPPPSAPGPREPRSLPAGAGVEFWGEAWRIFAAAPLPWILIVLIYVVISLALGWIPVVGGLVSTVLTPVFGGGVMLACHALARGEPLSPVNLFDGFREGRFMPLATLGLILLAITVVFTLVLIAGVVVTIGMHGLSTLAGEGDPMAVLRSGGLVAALVLLLIALTGAAVIAMAWWFAPALVALDAAEPVAALKLSFRACWTNLGALTIYGLVYIGLAVVASIPFGLGWLVLAPMTAGSCYASWRKIFGA
jgi:hypothetical protein